MAQSTIARRSMLSPLHIPADLIWPSRNRVWEQDYIWVKMDHRWTGAQEIMAELRDGAQGGVPWFAILDAAGEKLATSNALETGENIGFPSEETGRIHFRHMLNETRQRMIADRRGRAEADSTDVDCDCPLPRLGSTSPRGRGSSASRS